MRRWLHKIEVVTDKLVLWMLLVLIIIIYVEIVHSDFAHKYNILITVVDSIIVGIFAVDLAFKYNRSRNIPYFLRHYWIDILAVFPFFLLLRLVEGVYDLFFVAERITVSQQLLHESMEIEKEGAKIVQEVERAGKISRTGYFVRFLKPVARIPRFLKAIPFFEKPTGNHYHHEKIKLHQKKLKKRRKR